MYQFKLDFELTVFLVKLMIFCEILLVSFSYNHQL